MNDITPSQLRAWLSQDGEDPGENAINELFGIISGRPLEETIGSIKAFLDNQDD